MKRLTLGRGSSIHDAFVALLMTPAVGELFLAGPHITRRNVQREMVASGHAVVMPQYAKPCPWARGTAWR